MLGILPWFWFRYSLVLYTTKGQAHLSANVTRLDISAFSAAILLSRSFWEVLKNPCEKADVYTRDVKQISAPANLSELRKIPAFPETLQILYKGEKSRGTTEQRPAFLCSGSQEHPQLSLPPNKMAGAYGQPPAPVIPLLPLKWEPSSPVRVVLENLYACE